MRSWNTKQNLYLHSDNKYDERQPSVRWKLHSRTSTSVQTTSFTYKTRNGTCISILHVQFRACILLHHRVVARYYHPSLPSHHFWYSKPKQKKTSRLTMGIAPSKASTSSVVKPKKGDDEKTVASDITLEISKLVSYCRIVMLRKFSIVRWSALSSESKQTPHVRPPWFVIQYAGQAAQGQAGKSARLSKSGFSNSNGAKLTTPIPPAISRDRHKRHRTSSRTRRRRRRRQWVTQFAVNLVTTARIATSSSKSMA